MKPIFNHVDPRNLKNHPLNIKLYGGDKPDQELIDSVRENGVIMPIVVTAENVVIAGHRRRQSAIIADQKEVPVIVRRDLKDPLEVERALIHANKQRDKTTETKAREYKRLKEIEAELAEKRMKTGTSDPKKNFTEGQKKGQSRDIAAAEVGMSGPTAEKAAKVVDKIDELKAEGKEAEAAELTDKLNKSVSGAAKEVAPPKKKPPFNEKKIDDALGKLTRAIDARYEAKGGRSEQGECLKHLRNFDKALKAWRAK